MIVEDSEFIRSMTEFVLRSHGYVTFAAENGKVAIEMLKKQQFDLVLMDISMPVLDGREAMSIIKNKLKIPIKVIAYTSEKCMDGNCCEQYGFLDYLHKSCSKERLLQTLRKHLFSGNESKVAYID